MRVACAQLNIQGKSENFGKASRFIGKAARRNADVVVFPELFSTGVLGDQARLHAETLQGETVSFLRAQAREHAIWVVGSFVEKTRGKPLNSCVVIDRRGAVKAKYSKIHPFSFSGEHLNYSSGKKPCLFSLEGVKCGLVICYDLRFPELARALALKGAQVLFVPANWGAKRAFVWENLLQARAIENEFFVVGVNRTGKGASESYSGASMVVSPFGIPLGKGGAGEKLFFAELDLREVREARRRIPVFRDRRPGAYRL